MCQQGNFIYIDSGQEGWRDNLNQSMTDSLDLALESSAKVKFSIKNEHIGHIEDAKADVNYVARETVTQT